MGNILRNILLGAGTIGLASISPVKKSEAQTAVSGSIEYIQSSVENNSYPRVNMNYTLPLGVRGYTFAEFYKAGKGYFGRTNLNRTITSGVGPRMSIVHSGAPFTKAGIGVGATVPHLPRNIFASIGFLPFWVDNQGRHLENQMEFQYFANVDLPLGFSVNSFGNLNMAAQEGPQWSYGEINAGRNIGPFRVSYNPALLNDGDASPKLEHRATISVNFGGSR